jgi:hypothetical protein
VKRSKNDHPRFLLLCVVFAVENVRIQGARPTHRYLTQYCRMHATFIGFIYGNEGNIVAEELSVSETDKKDDKKVCNHRTPHTHTTTPTARARADQRSSLLVFGWAKPVQARYHLITS